MVIVVSSQKGGVGKTTTAVWLAHGLALKNYRVGGRATDRAERAVPGAGEQEDRRGAGLDAAGGVSSYPGIAKLLTTLDSLARPSAPVVWILPTFHDGTTKESRVNLGLLHERFGERVKQPVHRATLLREAAAVGKTVFEYAPESRAAAEYADLVLEVCRG